MQPDEIDNLLEQWRRERPDLDPAPMALVARLLRVARRVGRAVEAGLDAEGLQIGWFDVLSALRRAGEPHRLSPGQLAAALMLSTGGMTKRLDGMEQAALIRRIRDPRDRRALQIGLTTRGRALIDATVAEHIENEERLLSGLGRRERAELERLLRKLDASLPLTGAALG